MLEDVNVEEVIKKILEAYIDTKDPDFKDDTPLKDLGCDSLDLVELCMDIEEKFYFAIPQEEEDKLLEADVTFNSLKDLVLRFFNEEVVPTTETH